MNAPGFGIWVGDLGIRAIGLILNNLAKICYGVGSARIRILFGTLEGVARVCLEGGVFFTGTLETLPQFPTSTLATKTIHNRLNGFGF